MSRFLHALFHVIAFALQLVNVGHVPPPYQAVVAAVIAAVQGGVALANHGGYGGPVQ